MNIFAIYHSNETSYHSEVQNLLPFHPESRVMKIFLPESFLFDYTTWKESMAQLRCIGLSWPLTNRHRTWEWRCAIYFHYGLISHKPCSWVPSHLMPLPAWHQWWCLLTTLQRPKTAETGGAASTEQRRQVVLGGQRLDPRVGPNGNWFDHTILTCLGLKKKPTFAQDRAWLFLFFVGWEKEEPIKVKDVARLGGFYGCGFVVHETSISNGALCLCLSFALPNRHSVAVSMSISI